jgi:hypothetical protein
MGLVQQRNVVVEQQKYSVVLNVIHQKRNHAQISSLIFVFLKYKNNKVDGLYSGIFKILL